MFGNSTIQTTNQILAKCKQKEKSSRWKDRGQGKWGTDHEDPDKFEEKFRNDSTENNLLDMSPFKSSS